MDIIFMIYTEVYLLKEIEGISENCYKSMMSHSGKRAGT